MERNSEGVPKPSSPISLSKRISLVGSIIRQLPQPQATLLQDLVQSLLCSAQLGHLPTQHLLPGCHRRILKDPRPPASTDGPLSNLTPPPSPHHPFPPLPSAAYIHWMWFLDFLRMSWMPSRTLVMS